MIKFIDESTKLIILWVLVSLGWQLIEIIILHKINPNGIDTIISIILSLSLYKNFENQKWFNTKFLG